MMAMVFPQNEHRISSALSLPMTWIGAWLVLSLAGCATTSGFSSQGPVPFIQSQVEALGVGISADSVEAMFGSPDEVREMRFGEKVEEVWVGQVFNYFVGPDPLFLFYPRPRVNSLVFADLGHGLTLNHWSIAFVGPDPTAVGDAPTPVDRLPGQKIQADSAGGGISEVPSGVALDPDSTEFSLAEERRTSSLSVGLGVGLPTYPAQFTDSWRPGLSAGGGFRIPLSSKLSVRLTGAYSQFGADPSGEFSEGATALLLTTGIMVQPASLQTTVSPYLLLDGGFGRVSRPDAWENRPALNMGGGLELGRGKLHYFVESSYSIVFSASDLWPDYPTHLVLTRAGFNFGF